MKYIGVIIFMVLVFPCWAEADVLLAQSSNMAVKGGLGLGSILAIVLSWSRNNSILWAILHAILGWLYVIYFVFTR